MIHSRAAMIGSSMINDPKTMVKVQAAVVFLAALAASSVSSFSCRTSLQRGVGLSHIGSIHGKLCDGTPPFKPAVVLQSSSNDNDETSAGSDVPPPSQSSKVSNVPLDPLFQAVTRVDKSSADKRTMEIPLFGELILDQSLFLLVPIALFAVLGLVSAIIVLLSSTDEFAVALQESSFSNESTGAACRGLCQNDGSVDALRQYMMDMTGRSTTMAVPPTN